MKIIIDTHIFLWALYEPEKISKNKRQELSSPSNIIYVSSITFVEMMIKNSIGKLSVNADFIKATKDSGFELLDFNAFDAMTLGDMPLHHKDPFDRMLIAQAITNKYKLMSDDTKFGHYDCKLL